MDGTIHQPGEGERFAMGATSLVMKATEANTGGAFFLTETTVEAGFPGPPLHVHRELADTFYVLEGTLTFQMGEETVEGGVGTFVCAPAGTPHTFSNPSSEPARFLNFSVPGGFEKYMRRLAALSQEAGGAPDPAAIGALAADPGYDIEVVGPPIG